MIDSSDDTHTFDGVVITPGMRVYNYYDCEWGTIDARQFADGAGNPHPTGPGGQYFNGWYDFVSEAGIARRLDGSRMATREPQR